MNPPNRNGRFFGRRGAGRFGRYGRADPAAPRAAWLLVLVVGVVLYLVVERTMIRTENPHYVPSLLLLGSCTVPVAFLVFVASRSRPWTASGGLLAVTFLFGGVIGTVVAGQWEFTAMQELGTVPTIAVGAAEETAKLIAPVLVWITTRHRRAVDGLVLGIASGMGFAALETMGYGFVALLSTRGNLAAVDELLFVRGIMAPATHAAWAGLACAALFAAIASRGRGGPVLRFFVAFAAAVTLHALWDSNHSWPGYLVLGPISLALLLVAMHRAVRADGAGFGIR